MNKNYIDTFKLSKEDRKNIRLIMSKLEIVLDKIKPLADEYRDKHSCCRAEYNVMIYEIICDNKLELGLCYYAEKHGIELNHDMVFHYKQKVIPYTAYWSGKPETIFYGSECCPEYLYDSIKVRYENLYESLKIAKK